VLGASLSGISLNLWTYQHFESFSPQQTRTRYIPILILILILWESEGNVPFVDEAATRGNGVSLSRERGAVEILTTLRLLGVVKTHRVHAGVELVHLVDEQDLRK
jgi:hypothetical protein